MNRLLRNNWLLWVYGSISILLSLFSYCFVDRNLTLTTIKPLQSLLQLFQYVGYDTRFFAGSVYIIVTILFWIAYFIILRCVQLHSITQRTVFSAIILTSSILLLAYPAFSYDVFNYTTTARVTYIHKENPWIVRPIEIPNEPALAYTRAANKVALYGPSWILLTAIPHYLGGEYIWTRILAFKLLVGLFSFGLLYVIWLQTKSTWLVAFYGLNPLVLYEVFLGGHNDVVMMLLLVFSVCIYFPNDFRTSFSVCSRILGIVLLAISILVKGATIVCVPLYFFPRVQRQVVWYCMLLLLWIVFLLSPLREEMYPWYFVWCISIASLLPRSWVHNVIIAVSLGLLFRHVPYIVYREYDGIYSLMRTTITWIPLGVLMAYRVVRQYR